MPAYFLSLQTIMSKVTPLPKTERGPESGLREARYAVIAVIAGIGSCLIGPSQ